LLLVIIFVFDPLAIALVIAANFAFAQLTRRVETPLEEKVEDMRNVVEAYDSLDDKIKEYKIYQHQDKSTEEDLEWLEADLTEDIEEPENDWIIEDEDNERELEVEAAIDKIEDLSKDISSPEFFKKEAVLEEIKKLKIFLKSNNKDDDNTITYF
jgi:hypothetical protein